MFFNAYFDHVHHVTVIRGYFKSGLFRISRFYVLMQTRSATCFVVKLQGNNLGTLRGSTVAAVGQLQSNTNS